MQNKFSTLNLKPEILNNIKALGLESMTEIQSITLPVILSGLDVIGQAQTGSGKTAAFGIGVLSRLNLQTFTIQALVICPTRELAGQVATEIKKLARGYDNIKILTLTGGSPMGPQLDSLAHGAHIIVGTPGRLLDHLKKKSLNLSQVRTLVFDEADRMLEMGFKDDIEAIVKRIPTNRQTLLFSATFPDNIKELSADIQKNPQHLCASTTVKNNDIEQKFLQVGAGLKTATLINILARYQPESTVVFCTTKIQCDEVAQELNKVGISALAIHGDIEQWERDEVMVRFANKSVSVLIATDVAARGLDIKDLNAVINYEISKDPEVHVHRIGRTGRAGSKGLAFSMYYEKEAFRVKAIADYMKIKIQAENVDIQRNAAERSPKPQMKTLLIASGKKNKLRPGDILGALTKDAGIDSKLIGKINIFDFRSYVAIHHSQAVPALKRLSQSKIKNRNLKLRLL